MRAIKHGIMCNKGTGSWVFGQDHQLTPSLNISICTRSTSRSILGRHLTNSRSIVGRVSTDSWIDQKLVDSRPTFDRDFNGVSMECHPRCPRSSIDRGDWLTISIGNSTADALSTHEPMRPTTATFWNPNLLGASLLKMPSCLEVQL